MSLLIEVLRGKYVITHTDQNGRRALTFRDEPRYIFNSADAAGDMLSTWLQQTDASTITKVYGGQAIGTFKVTPVHTDEDGNVTGIDHDTDRKALPGEWAADTVW